MRSNNFLAKRLETILSIHFPDVGLSNELIIRFGRKAKTRLGSIKQDRRGEGASIITINGLFSEEFIPVEMIDATIAHELCHYAHGFSSSLPQLWSHPHRGGIVDRELKKRGLSKLLDYQKKWLKNEWPVIVKQHFSASKRRRKRQYRFIWI